MAGTTDHYGLTELGAGEVFSTDGYKYTSADRDTIDGLLYLGAEGHHHSGDAGSIEEPDTEPTLEINFTGGTLPAGTRVYYKYTYVNSRGEESAASPEAFIDTPAPVAEPGAPSLSYTSTGGVLQGGNYYYVLSAYVGASIQESKALNPVYITIPVTTATNDITLVLPDLPDYATGFNVYRRKPGQAKYFFVESIDMDVATPPSEYEDDGSVAGDADRTLPTANTTNSSNSIDITLPGATPTVPDGYTWKIYRTTIPAAWSSSLLVHVVENVTEGSTVITPTYHDTGISTRDGTFPAVSLAVGSPDKVDLTDAAEVQGFLPMGRVSAFPYVVTLFFPGVQTEGPGEAEWPCPFEEAVVVHACAALGRDMSPAADDLIVDVVIGRGATPTFTSVYDVEADMPVIAAGQNKTTAAATATAPAVATRTLELGDVLSADIIQEGGSATPTDEDLTITVLLYAHIGDEDTSEVWT